MSNITTVAAPAVLSVFEHRCDRCQAQAFVRVVVNGNGFDLLFCAHHYEEKRPALESCGVVTHDERDRINVKPNRPWPEP